MNFRIKEKLMLWISGSKKNLFQLNKLVQRWSFHSIYEAWVAYEMRKGVVQLYIKNNEVIFSLAWNIIFFDNFKSSCFEIFGDKERDIFEPKSWWKYDIYWLLKSSCFNLFGNGKYGLFLSQKVDGNMIFTDYWKVIVLNFSVMGNTVFFSAKKLMERWYLRALFELSMIFQDLGNMFFSRSAGNEQSIFVHELLKTVFIWFTMVNELGTLMYFLSFSCPD